MVVGGCIGSATFDGMMAVFACMNRMIFIIGSTREMCWSPMVNWEL